LNFHQSLGGTLRQIRCTLFSKHGADVYAAWDAIEDCISQVSGYQALIDVYGHFTEPHPLFALDMELLTQHPTPALRFAHYFSVFKRTQSVLPAHELEILWNEGQKNTFDLAKTAYQLRQFRFDIRVNETNTTIPSGYFRCVYPFTISIKRQVAVTWREA
jgi:DNA (cytosine-5)-methyltransferase 1